MTLKTSEVLDLAADKIQQHGWIKHTGWYATDDFRGRVLGHNDPALCLEGALMAAIGLRMGENTNVVDPVRSCPAYAAVQDYLEHTPLPLYIWNDLPERTAAEVIEVLRGAAAVERLREATLAYDTEDQPLPIEVAA